MDWWQRIERNIPVVVTNGGIGTDTTPVVTTVASGTHGICNDKTSLLKTGNKNNK